MVAPPFPLGDVDPHLIHGSLGWQSVESFLHSSAMCPTYNIHRPRYDNCSSKPHAVWFKN